MLPSYASWHGLNAVCSAHVSRRPLDMIQKTLNTNALGPIIVFRAFYPLLKAGSKKTVINISSNSGSITEHQQTASNREQRGPLYHEAGLGYAMSKAAINMGEFHMQFKACMAMHGYYNAQGT